jgi:hypothetical protein
VSEVRRARTEVGQTLQSLESLGGILHHRHLVLPLAESLCALIKESLDTHSRMNHTNICTRTHIRRTYLDSGGNRLLARGLTPHSL